MKAELNEFGVLMVIAENKLETFALNEWHKKNINGCTLAFKEESPRCFFIESEYPKITIFQRTWHKIRLFLYR